MPGTPDGFILVIVGEQSFWLPSFAKINLGLRVAAKRTDGYHDIETVFQTISLADKIRFTPADSLVLECDDRSIPVDNGNLIIRAAKLLAKTFGVNKGASLRLEKNIPSPGGLGGGSSNAAVTLLGLSKLWGIEVDAADLLPIAAQLGSDVPFFLTGGTAKGTGRGEIIEPIVEEFRSGSMMIVTPNIAISTAEAFKLIADERLTKTTADNILIVCRFEPGQSIPANAALKNDFERPIFGLYPEIGRAKEWLLDNGAAAAAMSGSGASVAGFFDNEETRQTAMKALGGNANWRSFAVATISRDEYREALQQVHGCFH